MKNILVIHYSQTGQLTEILDNFVSSFKDSNITKIKVEPIEQYPFPWNSDDFFNLMPETVKEIPIKLKPFKIPEVDYDLIILGYQPWFLSPSIPTTSILANQDVKNAMNGKEVITICGARNMWLNAFDSVRASVKQAGGKLILNVPLIDRNQNLISALTILHWLFGGKKDRKFGLLPIPGVHPNEIESVKQLGFEFWQAYRKKDLSNLQVLINDLGNVKIPVNILFIEMRAKRLFLIWANLIQRSKSSVSRLRKVRVFKYYLLIALFLVSPFVLLIFNLVIRPITFKTINKQRQHYLNI